MNAANERLAEATLDTAEIGLEALFRAQYERIARVIGGVIRDHARAEELAVEVFLKWERTPKAHGEGAEGWLYRAAVRVALNELRHRALVNRRHRVLATLAGKEVDTPHDLLASRQDRERVRSVLSAIDPRQAELLLLRSNDFSYQELASLLGLNPASVGTLLARALQRFREEFIARYGKERHGQGHEQE